MLNKEQINSVLKDISNESYIYEMIESPNKIYFIKYHRKLWEKMVTKGITPENIDRYKVANSISSTYVLKPALIGQEALSDEATMAIFIYRTFVKYLNHIIR